MTYTSPVFHPEVNVVSTYNLAKIATPNYRHQKPDQAEGKPCLLQAGTIIAQNGSSNINESGLRQRALGYSCDFLKESYREVRRQSQMLTRTVC